MFNRRDILKYTGGLILSSGLEINRKYTNLYKLIIEKDNDLDLTGLILSGKDTDIILTLYDVDDYTDNISYTKRLYKQGVFQDHPLHIIDVKYLNIKTKVKKQGLFGTTTNNIDITTNMTYWIDKLKDSRLHLTKTYINFEE